VDDGHRRRPVRDRVRREDEDAARAERERAIAVCRVARRLRITQPDAHSEYRRTLGHRSGRRRRLVGAAVEVRHHPDLEGGGAGGRDAFYKGPIARAIVADMKQRDGLLDERDFAQHTADWIEPISTRYRGYDVYELPPNTQGATVLEMLNILEGFDLQSMGY